jgi:hypothetical protein
LPLVTLQWIVSLENFAPQVQRATRQQLQQIHTLQSIDQ